MAENRTPRENVTREKSARLIYKPPSTLPDPVPEPGYTYRWIATHVMSQSTPANVSQRFREGWVPVRSEDHPELQIATAGNVEIGGLMLCKIATEVAESRQRYYEGLTNANAESVDNNFMRESDPRMPLFKEKHSSVTFGRGS